MRWEDEVPFLLIWLVMIYTSNRIYKNRLRYYLNRYNKRRRLQTYLLVLLAILIAELLCIVALAGTTPYRMFVDCSIVAFMLGGVGVVVYGNLILYEVFHPRTQ